MTSPTTTSGTRVALISIGIGRVQRGFERMFSDLFECLKGEMDVTLFKSDGVQTSNEKVPTLLWPATHLLRRLPLGFVLGDAEYHRDCAAFAATMLPHLIADRFDVIHYIDPPLAKLFAHLRRVFPIRPRMIFTDGCIVPLSYYSLAHHIHQPSAIHCQRALKQGIPASHITTIPSGVRCEQFSVAMDKTALRKKHGVSGNAFVVLAVSALKRVHKRVDYIIEEVAQLPGDDVMLWLDGSPEDESVCELARQRLGSRCRITYVPSAQVPELFQLADVLVHAALEESFAAVLVEAICARARVLAHASPHFEWLIQDRDSLVDMSLPGNLVRRLCELRAAGPYDPARAQLLAENARSRFDWPVIAKDYANMYRKQHQLALQGRSAAA